MYRQIKIYIVTALFISAIAVACNKQDTIKPTTELTGTWKYIGYSGGLAGFSFKPVDTVKNFLQFDASRILLNNDGLQSCSDYSFAKDSSGFSGLLTIKDTTVYPRVYDLYLSGDTLSLYPHDFADAFATYFVLTLKHFDWCDITAH